MILVDNTFDKGPDGWCSYDYHRSMVDGGENYFVLTVHRAKGGLNDSGYVWTDHTRWTADTPEKPLSVLPLIFYRKWVNLDPIDLRNAEVSVYLRGDGLKLWEAKTYFWVLGGGTRWHMTSKPLTVTDGRWAAEPNRIVLKNEESLWHMSWTGRTGGPDRLDQVLAQTVSYGFSFVGFVLGITGKLCMDGFQIQKP
jgi:hypothetical protein